MSSGAVRITVICDECVRIEYAPGADGRFVDAPSLFAIHGPGGAGPPDAPGRAVISTPIDPRSAGRPDLFGVPIVVQTSRMKLTYMPDGEPPNPRNMHALIEHPCPPTGVPMREGKVLWMPGAKNLFNLGGTLSTLDGLRGPVPLHEGLLARDGWHFIDDSRRHVLVDDWAMSREAYGAAGNMDGYLFAYGADYASAFGALATIAGKVPQPRRCTLGSWFSRYWPYTSAEFRGIVEEYHAHGFPLDVMVLDMDWHKDGWTGWSWNRQLLPDAEELMQWLHSQDLSVTLNLHPADGVGPHEDRYPQFMRALGREADGSVVPFDAGDRRYMHALFEQVHRPLEGGRVDPPERGAGVDFWWLDWQQDRFVRSMPGLTNLRWLNHLYMRHTTRAIGTLGPEDPGLRGVSFSRWAADAPSGDPASDPGWGDHRAPIHFSGDAHTGWPMLAFQVSFTATAGNAGCFFWSHDIGGHFGPRFEETTTRWVQFGALSPALRLHSARTKTLDRRPWTYEERFCNAMRIAFRLRSELMPTIVSAAIESCERTLPLLRPMYIEHPTIERAYNAPGQYMLGEHLLCAPIVTPGLGERCVSTQAVWFPSARKGESAWHELSTGERFDAGSEAIVAAAIDEVPVFVRAGVPLATRRFSHRMTTEPLDEVVVRLFPGRPGQRSTFELVEDDGVSLEYTRGKVARTGIVAEWSAGDDGEVLLNLTIGATEGRFRGQLPQRALTVLLHGVSRAFMEPVGDVLVGSTIEIDSEACLGTAEIWSRQRIEEGPQTMRFRLRPSNGLESGTRRRRELLAAALGRVGAASMNDATLVAGVLREPALDSNSREMLLAIGAGVGIVPMGSGVRLIDSDAVLCESRVRVRFIDRIGAVEQEIDDRSVPLEQSGTTRSRGADISIPESAGAMVTPPVGVRATRLVHIDGQIGGEAIQWDHEIESRLAPVRSFRVIGPFAWDWRWSIAEAKGGPETDAMKRRVSEQSVGKDGRSVGWVAARAGEKWDVDFRESFSSTGGVGYALTTIRSPIAQRARVFIECSDKAEMFVSGAKMYSLDAFDSHEAAAGYADIDLVSGDNTLLIKASDGGGGWGFSIGIEASTQVEVDAY